MCRSENSNFKVTLLVYSYKCSFIKFNPYTVCEPFMFRDTKQITLKNIPHLVFYDDACSLCSKEIEHYKMLEKCHPIEWIGIHCNQEMINQYDFNKQALLRQIHVIRSDGVIVIGAAAFATIWSAIKRYRFVSKIVYRFKLIPLLNVAYRYFAHWRYNKKYCNAQRI